MRAFIGVGSNLGDRWAHLAFAARQLRTAPRVALVRASRVYDTEPVGPPQPRYLNAVLELDTGLTPQGLHALLQLVELGAGRLRGRRWSARTLDLDLLLFENQTIHTSTLIVPHTGLVARRFVLAPLAELCPERIVPGTGASVAALLAAAPPLALSRAGLYPG